MIPTELNCIVPHSVQQYIWIWSLIKYMQNIIAPKYMSIRTSDGGDLVSIFLIRYLSLQISEHNKQPRAVTAMMDFFLGYQK